MEEDLIKREDVIQALVDCYEIRGYAYMSLMEALENIPAVKLKEPKKKTEFLVSTKAELVTEKVNAWIEANPDADILNMTPFMSYTTIKDKGAMMIGCMIEYNFREKNTDDYRGE